MDFKTTRWTLIGLASSASDAEAASALEELCRRYWPPLYAYARSLGRNHEDARDLTQGFFAYILEKRAFERARSERGKFRNFLLAAMKNYVTNEWHRNTAQKRGGQQQPLSIDVHVFDESVSSRLRGMTPERAFEVQWATAILERALAALDSEHPSGQRRERFLALRDYIAAHTGRVPYARLATQLGISEETARVALYRLRARYGSLIREEIEDTLGPGDDPQEEIKYLLSVLSGP